MFMHRNKLKNVLSFGPEAQELELRPLNVLIGPNGSGKSNLIEVIGLLGDAPTDIAAPMREGGGGNNRVWHGEPKVEQARVEVIVEEPFLHSKGKLLHFTLAFGPLSFGMPDLQEGIGEVGRGDGKKDSPERYLSR